MKGVFLLFFLFCLSILQAQEYKRCTPFLYTISNKNVTQEYQIKPLELKQVYREDSIQFVEYQQVNIARLQKIDVHSFLNPFIKRLNSKQFVWRTEIKVPNAKGLALKIKKIVLPRGTRLFMYSPRKQNDLFLVFDAENKAYQLSNFITEKLEGETIILEYNATEDTKDSVILDIEGLVNYYEKQIEANPGFGQSTECEVNVACSEGEGWCNESQSVVRIFIQSGSLYSYCTGSVLNNTKQDFTPYVLTAEHCGAYATEEDFKYWKFEFNYQSDGCSSPSSESEIISNHIYGCQQLAKARRESTYGSDFRLVKLLDSIPKAWNIYYAGWDAEEHSTITGGGVGIHHPYGDIKKISSYVEDLVSSDAYGGDANDEFWKTYWIATENGHGITEGGSSGSPLFNNKGLIIGTLSTGSSYCDNRKTSPDYYGKMSRHWDGNGEEASKQLEAWLDPLNTGILQLGGKASNEDLECGDKISFDDFSLFPNPVSTILRVGNDDLSYLADAVFEIYDSKGILVKSLKTSTVIEVKQIDISHLSSGIYVLKVIQSNWLIQQKFVILR